MMQRYNESADTFSFALVLLCLAAGNIGYVRKKGRMISRTAYASGWRPPIPGKLRERCPDLASLISEMWDGDFRKRPALKGVVPRGSRPRRRPLWTALSQPSAKKTRRIRFNLAAGGVTSSTSALSELGTRLSGLRL